MINYDRYGLCCVWHGLFNQECMNEWACITFCNQARCLGVAGGNFPLSLWFLAFFFFCLSAQSRKVMMIIPLPSCSAPGAGDHLPPPHDFFLVVSSAVGHGLVPLPHYDFLCVSDSPPPPPPPHTHTHTRWATFFMAGAKVYGSRSSKTYWQFCPPPPQANILAPPLALPHYGNNPPPPPRWLSFSGPAQCSARHFCPDCGSVVASLPWCGMWYCWVFLLRWQYGVKCIVGWGWGNEVGHIIHSTNPYPS